MGCHAQVWPKSIQLEPVRRSYYSGEPLRWNRVHHLPDYVYFNHAIHVNKGVGCVSCHGRVDEMAVVYQVAPLSMGWCLDCHRAPEPSLRPLSRVTSMDWQPPVGQRKALGKKLAALYGVRTLTNCTTCHRSEREVSERQRANVSVRPVGPADREFSWGTCKVPK
jgi:hypothetical protein